MNNLSLLEKQALNQELYEVLQQLEDWLGTPMLVLGFAWLILFVIEIVWGLSPLLKIISTVIRGIFILDFTVKFLVAPRKFTDLKRNWLTSIALLLPALQILKFARVLRVLSSARATRGLQLFRTIRRSPLPLSGAVQMMTQQRSQGQNLSRLCVPISKRYPAITQNHTKTNETKHFSLQGEVKSRLDVELNDTEQQVKERDRTETGDTNLNSAFKRFNETRAIKRFFSQYYFAVGINFWLGFITES